MIALIESYRAGLLKPPNWPSNIMAGLVVGIVAVPLSMAFAIASGAKPEQGLYTAIVASVIVAIFGGSRVQIAGPTGAFIAILATITAHHGIAGLQMATLLAGIILLMLGLMRLGTIIQYIPTPVIIGFTSGIGVIIFVGQWKDFFGLPVSLALDAPFHHKLVALLQTLPQLHPLTTALSCLSLALLWLTPKIFKRIPGPLVAMLVITLLQMMGNFGEVATIGSSFGEISRHLPALQWPHLSLPMVWELAGSAITIAILGAIESLLSATVADNMTGAHHHPNQELIGQGLANIVSPLLGGFAATGAIARTATNIRNGGTSPLAALVHAGLLVMVILLLAPYASHIPLCSMAAILFVVAYNMSDIPRFISLCKQAPAHDLLLLFTTFLLTIFVDLVTAISAGMVLAMLPLLRHKLARSH